jgi:VirE-like protein/primase-like protein
MSIITIYKNFGDTSKGYTRHINHALNRIKTGSSKELIDRIRLTGNKELKNYLPCILFSGEFSYRNAKSITKHSGFICIDFDKFPDSDTLLSWKDSLEGDEYTYSVFLSPSGYGLKCIVKIPPDIQNHKRYFDALKDYYNCKYFDINCSDVCRICYESYDPYLTINQNSSTWYKAKEYTPIVVEYGQSSLDHKQTADNLIKWWNRRYGLFNGQRNANLFRLCAAFNDYGIPKDFAYQLVSEFQQEDFNIDEIEKVLNNGYKKTEKFATLKF